MSPRILVVDDDEVNVELLVELLADDYPLTSTAADGFEALAKVESERPDLILLDIMMPDLDGFEVCRRIKADPAIAHIRVLMVTALTAVDDLVRGFEAGANDFITKPISVPELRARVREQLRQSQEYERVREQALADRLTGAFNGHFFYEHAPRLAARYPVAVFWMDVDNLKQINDAHGHAVGDRVLKQVVNGVTSTLRPSDLMARIGGDEFAVVMPQTDLDSALRVAERLRRRIGDTPIEGIIVTVSIGVTASTPEEEFDTTLERADAAMYEAKKVGGNRVRAGG
jgi:diguanylate cyclase (GGDEF)-like protein